MKVWARALAAAIVLASLPSFAAARIADPWLQASGGGESLEIDSYSPFVPSAIGKDATARRINGMAGRAAAGASAASSTSAASASRRIWKCAPACWASA
ncbi:MAG: hypothetical protein K0S54_435 [Alphaproteobacteria bacterium]|jgi:hypothetical protein|nr:hypothetical protein [Alphaproteobacteria bacterium]